MKIVEVASGLDFPEGPVWVEDGSVIFVEVANGLLRRVSPEGKLSTVADLGGGPNGAAFGPDGALYVCNNGGFAWHRDEKGTRPHAPSSDYRGGSIQRVDVDTGRFEVLYDKVDGRSLLGPNDIVFDRTGGFWFTDLGKARPAERTRDIGSVYYAKADGSFIQEVLYPIVTPNGIALSPDEKTLYVADTEPARIWAYDIVSPGVIDKRPFPSPHGGRLVIACGDNVYQRFDSMAVDGEGNINVATLYRSGITIASPFAGRVSYIEMPDLLTTNICFGGSDLRTAFITLSAGGRLVKTDWPTAGLRLNFQC